MSETTKLTKLGYIGTIPIVPMLPTGAQVSKFGYLHLQLMGGSYVSGSLAGAVPVDRAKIVQEALKGATQEPSYSGSNNLYRRLDVEAINETTFRLKIGDVEVCKGLIDPSYQIASGDEKIEHQQADEDEAVDGEGEAD